MPDQTLPKVTLYSDGGAVPNPGKAGYGIILCYKDIKREYSQGYTLSTNNRMEMMGVITGLSKLNMRSEVDVYTDSQYTINGIQKGWAKKWKSNNWMRTKTEKATNYDLWERLLDLVDKHTVHFHWVKGHNGHIENERCDELATLALNSGELIPDTGFVPKDIALPLITEKKPAKPLLKKNTNIIAREGDICGKCNTPVEKRIPKKKKLKPNQTFYYEYFFNCPGCKTNYMVPEGKRDV